jgi:hypothetical protein
MIFHPRDYDWADFEMRDDDPIQAKLEVRPTGGEK